MTDKYIFPTESLVSKRRVFKPISQLQLNEYYILNFQRRKRELEQLGELSGTLAVSDVDLQYVQAILFADDIPDLDYAYVDESDNIYIGGQLRGTQLSSITLPNTNRESLVSFIVVLNSIFIPIYYLFFIPTTLNTLPPIIAGVRLLRDELLGNRLAIAVNYQAGFSVVKYPSALTITTVSTSAIASFRVLYINPVSFVLNTSIGPTGLSGNIVQVGQHPVAGTPSTLSTVSNPSTLVMTSSLDTSGNTLLYSTTGGTSWIGLGNATLTRGTSAVWTGGLYLATGSQSGNSIARSADGITWSGLGNSIVQDAYGTGVITTGGNTTLLVFGQGANTIAYSTDNAVTWTGLGNSVFTQSGYQGVYNGHIMVATGTGANTLAYSTNGTQWYGLGNTVFTEAYGVAWGVDRWVAVGNGTNSISTSWNGTGWLPLGASVMSVGKGVAYGNNMYVVVGQGANTIAYSPNAFVWTGLGTGILSEGTSVSYNGSHFIATGNGNVVCARSSDGISWTTLVSGVEMSGITGSVYSYTQPLSLASYIPLRSYLPLDYETNGILLPITVYPSSTFTWNSTVYNNTSGQFRHMLSSVRYNGTVLRASTLQPGTLYSADTDPSSNIYPIIGTTSTISCYGLTLTTIGSSMNIFALRLNNLYQGQWSQFVLTPPNASPVTDLPVQVFLANVDTITISNPYNGSNIITSDGSFISSASQHYLTSARLDTATGTIARQDIFPWSSAYASSVRFDPFSNGLYSGIATTLSLPLPYGDIVYPNSEPFVFIIASTPANIISQVSTGLLSPSTLATRIRNYFTVSVVGLNSTYYDFYTLSTSSSTIPTFFNRPITGLIDDGIGRSYIVVAQYGVTYI